MVRRRDGGAYSFDLVADDELDAALGGAPGDERPSLRERMVARLRGTTPKQRGVAAGVALVAVLAVAAGTAVSATVQSRQVAERLRAAPGGVVSIPSTVSETWALQAGSTVLAVLTDGGILTSVADTLVAIDVSDGTARWRVELGADVECGPQPRFDVPVEWTRPNEQVVCLAGPADARIVTVLDADGAVVGRRALDDRYPGDRVFVAPAGNGALAVLELSGTLPERVEADTTDELFAQLEKGWVSGGDAVLRLEDALTGGTRAETRTPWPGVDHLWECLAVTEGPRAVADFDPGAHLRSSPTVVGYRHCGVDVALTPDGERVEWPDVEKHFFWHDRFPYPDGGFVVNAVDRGRVVDASGDVLVDVPGLVLSPMATDGTADDTVLAVTSALAAYERDGRVRWWSELGSGLVLVRAAGVVVVDDFGSLVALDVGTGEERWRSTDVGGAADYAGTRTPTAFWISAVTDGRSMLASVDVRGWPPRSTLVRVDLGTGKTTAAGVELDGRAFLAVVDGNVLVQVPQYDPDTEAYGPGVETVRGLGPA